VSRLVLASASPRRRELLGALGLEFAIAPADLDEEAVAAGRAPAAGALAVASGKADVVAAREPDTVVLAGDTIVVLDGVVLGKPRDPQEARRMLGALCDRTHEVFTAVVVRAGSETRTGIGRSVVRMRGYTAPEIDRYVATGAPLDKAGAYGVQDGVFDPVAAIDGCYCNVMGLPLWTVTRLLGDAGCPAPRRPDEAFARCAGCPGQMPGSSQRA
jgi:septum formation protein